jgi:hypothetical protein
MERGAENEGNWANFLLSATTNSTIQNNHYPNLIPGKKPKKPKKNNYQKKTTSSPPHPEIK